MRKVHARFYGTKSNRPVTKTVFTQINSRGRSPRLDLVMGDNRLQPHIHDGIVTVIKGRRTTRFHIFVKNHRRLRSNGILERWNMPWKGDIVVMRKGISDEVVNIRANDASLADFAVKK